MALIKDENTQVFDLEVINRGDCGRTTVCADWIRSEVSGFEKRGNNGDSNTSVPGIKQ